MSAPMRVGILDDMAEGPPGVVAIERGLRMGVEDLTAAGRLDREVEFVYGYGLGLPSGTAAVVERAFTQLVDQDVLLVVGPAIGDNALVATPLAERHRVPTINWAGSERARGEYMFHLQVGSHEDESIVLARHLASLGVQRVGVVADRSPIGHRYLHFFQAEAELVGLRIAATASLPPLADDATAEVDELVDARVDATVYLGLGLALPAVARGVRARDWEGIRVTNTCGLRGYQPEFARLIDGWTYIDMWSDGNRTLTAFRERLGLPPSSGYSPARDHDLSRLVAEGLARAPERTRDGVKDGLEQVKWLPAAEGHEGTLLGFGVHDRGALHGRYLVVRRWLDGETIEVPD